MAGRSRELDRHPRGHPATARCHDRTRRRTRRRRSDCARHLHAVPLIDADTDWAVERVLPLFDWDQADRATKVWDGYLTQGRWHNHALIYLLPRFRASFSHLSTDLAHQRDQFCSFLAHIAIQSTIHPLEDGWLNEFLGQVDDETTVSWARAVERALKATKEAATTDQWDRWISRYWQLRTDGVPKTLTAPEASAMTVWLLHAGTHFPSATTTALTWPGGLAQHDHLIYTLAEHQLVADYPDMMAKLLAKLLRQTQGSFFLCDYLAKIVGQVREQADEDDLRSVCNEALRLGCTTAGTWLNGEQSGS